MGPGAERVRITQEDPNLTIHFNDNRERVLYTDGRSLEEQTQRGLVSVKAEFKKKGRLVVKTVPFDGPEATETWKLSEDRERLTIEIKVKTPFGSTVSFERVYDAVSAEALLEPGR